MTMRNNIEKRKKWAYILVTIFLFVIELNEHENMSLWCACNSCVSCSASVCNTHFGAHVCAIINWITD